MCYEKWCFIVHRRDVMWFCFVWCGVGFGAVVAFEMSLWNILPMRRTMVDPGLNLTYFGVLYNYVSNAMPASEQDYPWIARVLHSQTKMYPHMCTASCIHRRIFITSAGCLYTLKTKYTSVHYQDHLIPAIAFVLPKILTKQAFDSIGIIVVDNSYKGSWETVDLINRNRSGVGFQWFADWSLSFGQSEYKAIGYGVERKFRNNRPSLIYDLCEVDVVVNINLCYEIYSRMALKNQAFYVPCYLSCTLHEFNTHNAKCKKMVAVDGGAVYDVNTRKLLGVATWSSTFAGFVLPVGFSVPNSVAFYKNYECAKRIQRDNGRFVTSGYYQSLCLD